MPGRCGAKQKSGEGGYLRGFGPGLRVDQMGAFGHRWLVFCMRESCQLFGWSCQRRERIKSRVVSVADTRGLVMRALTATWYCEKEQCAGDLVEGRFST